MVVSSHIFFIWCFVFLSTISGVATTLPCKDVEKRSLLTFKAGLTDKTGRLSSWSDGVDSNCCNWEGVGCSNQTGHVLKLNLRNPYAYYDYPDKVADSFKLVGKMSSSLLELKYLEYLDLSVNNFTDTTIPKFLGSLENLRYLNLSYSLFSGLIPPHLGNLSSLRYLDLGSNHYPKVESLEWLTSLSSLKHLNLDRVNFTKVGPQLLKVINMLPASLLELHLSLCDLSVRPLLTDVHSINLTSLSTLDLSYTYNFYESPHAIPPWLFNLSGLINLNLRGSNLVVISNEIGNLVELQHLNLAFNYIKGQLPVALGNVSKLVYLDLYRNSFCGSIPETFGMLTSLRVLDLTYNQMNGTIGEAISQLPNLRELYLSRNPWQGLLSETHFEKLTKLRKLHLERTSDGNLILDLRHGWIPPFRKSMRSLRFGGVKIRSETFPPWIQTLHHLEALTLRDCGIVGDIPMEFWKSCTNISYLEVQYGAISISASFKNLEALFPLVPIKLHTLVLVDNFFSGDEIPINIGQLAPSLIFLSLYNNSLSGKIPLSICELKSLYFLDLSNNFLTGEISQHSWKQLESLQRLYLSRNNLVGNIPKSLGSLNFIYVLLNDNRLEGEIPAFVNSTSLRILDFGRNNFTGQIPASLGENKPDMVILRLRGNMLSGLVPRELCLLSGLKTLDLAQNSFQGIIPRCLGNLSSSSNVDSFYSGRDGIKLVTKSKEYTYSDKIISYVHLVDLSDNNLSGDIPENLMNLTALQTLNLSMNHLTGEIPSNIGVLQKLESLDLSTNQLSGPIPLSIADISFLSYLNLSHNNLSGNIPSSRQLQTLDETSSYDGNPFLCGLPLPTKCPGEGTSEGKGEEKVKHGKRGFDLDKWGLILSLISGFLVGFWGVCGSLVLKASWRKAYFGVLEDAKDKIVVMAVVNVARLRRKMADIRNLS